MFPVIFGFSSGFCGDLSLVDLLLALVTFWEKAPLFKLIAFTTGVLLSGFSRCSDDVGLFVTTGQGGSDGLFVPVVEVAIAV